MISLAFSHPSGSRWFVGTPPVETLDAAGGDTRVRILERFDHLPKNAEQFFRLGRRCHLRPELLVHGLPVHVPQIEEGVVFGKRLPEDRVILLRSVFRLLFTSLRLGGDPVQDNIRDSAVEVYARIVSGRPWQKVD